MKGAHSLAGLLLLVLVQSSWQVPDGDSEDDSSLTEDSMFNDPSELTAMKRHSEGTFSNDYSKYLETRRAQDFVQWLKNSKRRTPADVMRTGPTPATSAPTSRTRLPRSLSPG
ncbi:glucagon b isoform X2 [Osmerus eperlanus]|uniref:glucagon b isoform X2 n=1 Tax=Osmerus eperlanus TaxID=29151 RepID=UPI002E0FD325